MIPITKNELSILCRVASIINFPIVENNVLLDEDIIEETMKSLESKNIIKDKSLTEDGEYIVRTLSMIEECDKFSRINNMIYCLLSNNRYGLIIEAEDTYSVLNLSEEAILRVLLLSLSPMEDLKESSYKRILANLDNVSNLLDDIKYDNLNISINYNEDEINSYSIFLEKNGKLNNIIADRNVIEEYGVNNLDKLITKSFKYLKGE